jgi:hypothetical protein
VPGHLRLIANARPHLRGRWISRSQRARRACLLLRAEPLARTDSWVTLTVKSQHISSVGFGPKPDTSVRYTDPGGVCCPEKRPTSRGLASWGPAGPGKDISHPLVSSESRMLFEV